ncbi:mono-functional DNA-alkylating methyl methanesulfonate N-term-domain-containing protein [Spinellus fusiger]|nr:mono-functional DNA-alkylating methyl methanesulfonate N-term-domain-containing protein [Spinellus fusiger]
MNDTMSRSNFSPVMGRGSISEDGILWQMEFLLTQTPSPTRIVMALIVYSDIDKLCRVVVYAFNATDPRRIAYERIGRLPLERNTPLPVLLISLKYLPEAFLVVTESHLCLLTSEDTVCGNVQYPTSLIPRDTGRSIWSEEGHLYRIDIHEFETVQWTLVANVNPIGQSMCILNTVIRENTDGITRMFDTLLYAGEGADSQIIEVERSSFTCSQEFKVLQSFINRAPLHDFQIVSDDAERQDKIIACTGQTQSGVVNVIRQGYQTTLISVPNTDWDLVTKVWSVQLQIYSVMLPCLVVSFIDRTSILCLKGKR